jgi:hypothetical protein
MEKEKEKEKRKQARKKHDEPELITKLQMGVADPNVFRTSLHLLQHQMMCMELADDLKECVRFTRSGWTHHCKLSEGLHTIVSKSLQFTSLFPEDWRAQGVLVGLVTAYQCKQDRKPGAALLAVCMRAANWYAVVNTQPIRSVLQTVDVKKMVLFPSYDSPSVLLQPDDYLSWYRANVMCECAAVMKEKCRCCRTHFWDVALTLALCELFTKYFVS